MLDEPLDGLSPALSGQVSVPHDRRCARVLGLRDPLAERRQ
jgi:hypothetical protein